jgi:UDP-hydrolysing UDP-N-acetyl-D-glucosamine 2-epimerase
MGERTKFGERLGYGLHGVKTVEKKKGKVLVVITNRSSYGKVKTVIEGLVALSVDVVLVLSGSLFVYKYGAAGNGICDDWPSLSTYCTDTIIEGNSDAKMADSVGVLTTKLTTIITKESPDLVITIADRFETLGTAIAASYMNVGLVHIQGGEMTGSIDNKVRDAVTCLSDWHFPATEGAALRISDMLMGSRSTSNIWDFGCPSMDLLERHQPAGYSSELKEVINEVNSHGVGYLIDESKPFIIVIYHPDTNDEEGSCRDLKQLIDTLDTVKVQKIVFWPNIDSGSDQLSKLWRMSRLKGTRYIINMEQSWFARLLWWSSGIVGNSSAGIREASYYGVPSVDIGSRQMCRDVGPNTVRVDPICQDIGGPVREMIDKERVPSTLYGDGNAGNKIAKRISEILEEK